MKEGKTMPYNPKYNEQAYKYRKEKLKRVGIDFPNAYYRDVLIPEVEKTGLTLSGYIKAAISEKIARGERSGKADGAAMQGHGLDGDAAPAQGP